MDDFLFHILALAATAGFILGIISGWLPLLLVSLLLAGLFIWLTRNPK
ncbi:MAG: hypothetical protein P1U58_14220 [Verrucomicrobiales bacterium]|nr:hypothetical protein [Verrucomicrobiales bacterium]